MHNHRLHRKKFLILLIILVGTLSLLSGCGGYPSPAPPVSLTYLTGIVVRPDTMDLEEGESQYIISVTAYYSDSSTANIPLTNCSYYSYNHSCATANSSGLITGVSTGTAVILVIYTEGVISKADTVTINVTTAPINSAILSYIEVLPSVMSLSVGESQTFDSVTAYYSDSSTANINLPDCNYSSSDPACATVSNSGTITAVSDGLTTITVSYTQEGITKTTSAEITVGTVTQNEVVYRALCVGVGDYIQVSDNDLSAPSYDVDRIRQILQQCRFGTSNTTFSNIGYLKDWQATKSNILQNISSTFSGADSNDISYFYFSGHGSRLGNTSYIFPADVTSFTDSAISVDELENVLSSIPGIKVVILDSCHSGGFIGKTMDETTTPKEELEFFNNDPFGVFTMALCEGCGYSGNYLADTNMDTMVSLQEAYLYIKDWFFSYGVIQDVQVYPNNSTFSIVEY
jgi:hypothetical protein